MSHILVPLLVVGVLGSVPTAPVIDCCFVCIGVEDVDVPKPSTHFDCAVSSTSIIAPSSITGSLGARIGAYALWAVLQASVVIISRGAVCHTPEKNKWSVQKRKVEKDLIVISLPFRCIVPEVVVRSLKEHPVKIVEGVLEAPDIGKVGGVVGGVLVDGHGPWTATAEVTISWARHVAIVHINHWGWGLIHADTTLPILKTGICKACSIAWYDASEIAFQFSSSVSCQKSIQKSLCWESI